MYVIKYNQNQVYAGTYRDMDSSYLYDSNYINKIKPKIFKTLKGVQNHLNKLRNRIPYPDDSNLRIEVWSEEDYQNYLISIGLDFLKEKKLNEEKKQEKYWKKVFKKVKGEIEVIRIEIEDNVGIVTYYMPYSTYEHEFFFQADLDTDKVISAFCDAVNQGAENMIQTIRDCSKDLKNLF